MEVFVHNDKEFQIEQFRDIQSRLDKLDNRVFDISKIINEIYYLRIESNEIKKNLKIIEERTKNVGEPCENVRKAREEIASAKKAAGILATFLTVIIFPIVTVILRALGLF